MVEDGGSRTITKAASPANLHGMNQPPPQMMGPVPLGMTGPQSALGHPSVGMTSSLVAAGPPVPPGLGAQGPLAPTAMGGANSQLPPVNPATNDAPLEFNLNKNKPPMPIPGSTVEDGARREFEKMNSVEGNKRQERGRDRERTKDRDRERDRERDRSHDSDRGREKERSRERAEKKTNNGDDTRSRSMSPASTSSGPAVVLGGSSSSVGSGGPPGSPIGIGPTSGPNMWSGMMGMGYTMMGMMPGPMMSDPGMMGMSQFGMMGPNMGGIMPGGPPVKEIIHCKSCTLFPPNPNAPPPTTRERPPGCRTVFVGGLPENVTAEEIIREIFERCGEITIIRMSKKNFCHIRFELEAYVDNAIYLSGYRIRIGSNTDPPNTGRLHVDYAQARDDLYEWECRQRQLQREQRHRERLEQERLRPPSPPPVVHYTDHEAQSISEKLKGDDTFIKAVQVLITWLERGDCSKRNSNSFYSMVQSSNSHVRRLMNEKGQYEEELQRAKDLMKQRMQGILMQ